MSSTRVGLRNFPTSLAIIDSNLPVFGCPGFPATRNWIPKRPTHKILSWPVQARATTSAAQQVKSTATKKPMLWAKILVITSPQGHEVKVSDDTGTDVNWIHPQILRKCSIPRVSCQPRIYRDFQGNDYAVTEYVRVRWCGKNENSKEDTFYVAPEASAIGMVFGNNFVRERGRIEDYCSEKLVREMRTFAFRDMRAEEQKQKQRIQEQTNYEIAAVEQRRKLAKDKDKAKQSSGSSTKKTSRKNSHHKC